jgi:hypothetical protein
MDLVSKLGEKESYHIVQVHCILTTNMQNLKAFRVNISGGSIVLLS